MNEQMNSNTKIWVVTIVTLVAIALVAALWAFYSFTFPQRLLPRPDDVQGDLELYYISQTVVSTVNVSLLIFLLTTYVDIYRRTRSQFTFGLIIFALAFFLRTVTANPLFMRAFGFAAFGLGPFALVPEIFELVALSILLYLSAKY